MKRDLENDEKEQESHVEDETAHAKEDDEILSD